MNQLYPSIRDKNVKQGFLVGAAEKIAGKNKASGGAERPSFFPEKILFERPALPQGGSFSGKR
jgi:hypothetical protein